MFFSSQKPIYSLPAVRLGWLLVILLALLVPPRGAQAQPGSLRMTGSTTTSVTIAWDGVGAGATYEYQQVLPRLRSSVNVGSVTTTTITSLGHSTYYGFQIRSILNGVTSDWTGGVADGHTKPLAPPNFRATCVAGTFVELKWNAPQQSQVSLSPTSFQYEVKINSGAWQSRAGSRTRKVDQLSLGTTYTFAVRTVLDRSGLAGYSDASTLTVTTAAAQVEPPTGLQTSAVSDTSVKLTWTASTTSSVSYEVSTDGSTWVDSGSDLEHIFSGLDPETRYSLRARAKSGSSTSCANAAPLVTTLPTAPSAPTNLQTSGISQTAITLSWSKSTGATAYKVQANSGTVVTLGDVATHTFSGLTANTQYTLEVIASNAGGESSAASVSARTLVNAPATPTDLASLGGTHNSITISWTKSAGATAYKVQVNSGDVTTLGDVATHTFSGLTADTSYTLKVVASNAGGDSSAVSVSARTKLVTPPVTLGTVTHNSIVINWTKSTGATAYKVRKDSSDDWTTLGDVATHTFSGLTPNTAYDIEVLASNSHGDSAAGTVTGTTTHDLDATATHNANLTATHNANLTATANANLTATANANLTATANANLTATANANLTATANANLTATQLVLSNGATQTQQAVNLTATANAPTATSTSTPTPTATSTSTPTPTATSTSTPTPTATATSTPTATATATANANLTATANANLTATHNANLTATHNANLTATHNANLTATHNANLTATHNANLTATHNANLTATHNANLTATANANLTATHNANLTATANANMTATQNANLTATHNANLTATHNANLTATQLVLSNSVTQTQQAINLTATASVPTATPTPTPTPTATATSTPTPTATATPTLTNTPLPGSPAAPTNLQTSGISQTAITLSWSKSTGATAYKVQANSGTVLTLGDVATHTFSGLTADTQYTLKVIASNAGGDSSAASVSARTQSASPTALADPSGVSTSGITQTSITLNWTKESAASSYEVQGGSHSSWHDVGDVATYTFSGLTANTQYILQVRSKNSQTTSTGISITRSTLVNPPAPPSNLNSDSISDGGFNIDWDQSSGASGYETRGDDMSDSPGSQAAGMLSEWTNIGNVNTYSYSGLEPDTLYRIYVRAGNSGGMSEPRHIDVRTLASPDGIGENTRSNPGSNDFPGFDVPPRDDVPPSDDDSDDDSSSRSSGGDGGSGSESGSEPTATATISSPAFNCTSQQKAMIDISSQPIGLNLQCVGPKGVGNADLIERGVVLGVDVWGWVRNFEVCFKQAGELVFLDAAYAPRLLTSARPYSRGGMICSQLDRAGTLVLLRGDTPQLPVATAETTESTSTQRQFDNCRVTLADFLNFRATPGGQVMLVLPAGVSLSVLDWQGDWVQVDYYGRKGWLHSDYLTAQGDCG